MARSTAKRSGILYDATPEFTKEGKARVRRYHLELGRFVDMFARIETAIAMALWHYAKTPPHLAKVIFSSDRMDTSSTKIKQLARASGASKEKCDDLDFTLQQLSVINGVRNNTLHYGAQSVAGGNAIVSDAVRARGEPKTFPISPESLKDMTEDLRKIAIHLYVNHLGRPVHSRRNQSKLAKILRAPWRYKHPQSSKLSKVKAPPSQ